MTDNFFGTADAIKSQVDSGAVKGFQTWPVEGQAFVHNVSKEYKNGSPYVAISMSTSGRGLQKFFVRVPQEHDKEMAKFLGIQKLYKTLYVVGNVDVVGNGIGVAFEAAQKRLEKDPIPVSYVLSEYETISEKNGKAYTNQSLEELKPLTPDLWS